jgi:proteic killer suppression protein
VDISFANKELGKWANDDRKALKEMGKVRADLYKKRLSQLKAADSLEDLRHVAGNYHELTNNRKAQWACDLDQPYRLIFKPQEIPIPINEDGQYLWEQIKAVEIIEVVNYHKER